MLHRVANDGKLYFSVDRSNGGGSSGSNRQLTRPEKYATLEQKQEAIKKLISEFENEVEGAPEPDAEGALDDDWADAADMMDEMKIDDTNAKRTNVAKVTDTVLSVDSLAKADALFDAVLQDLKGQVSEAVSTGEFWKKWGDYYFRSLMFAYVLQKRNNFKDFGVQVYGGKDFEKFVDHVNNVFDSTEPPKPSRKT